MTCFVLALEDTMYELNKQKMSWKDAIYEDEKENSHLSLTGLLLSPLLWLSHLELVLATLYSFL